MTKTSAGSRPAGLRPVAAALLLSGGLLSGGLLAGCSPNGQAGSKLRVYAADVVGVAKLCEVPKVQPVAGRSVEAAVKVGNDGGWCGLRVQQGGEKPYAAGLLVGRAAHGSVKIHEVGDDTRIDYTPDRRFTGTDTFTVKLVPGDAVVQVAVTVAPAS